jgi:hypothetical protein
LSANSTREQDGRKAATGGYLGLTGVLSSRALLDDSRKSDG